MDKQHNVLQEITLEVVEQKNTKMSSHAPLKAAFSFSFSFSDDTTGAWRMNIQDSACQMYELATPDA